jgi:adenylate cyclase class IV
MPTNVEWKAHARDFDRQRALAEALAGPPLDVLEQTDAYFPVSAGRLKLRRQAPARGELIHYFRENDAAPRRSDYRIAETCQPDALARLLADALGVGGVVRKRRWLYLAGRTRIHFDEVEGLGRFVEVEVVVRAGESLEEAQAEAEEFLARLAVAREDLVATAYVDQLRGSA